MPSLALTDWVQRGVSLLLNGENMEGAHCFFKVLAIDPANLIAHNNLGHVEFELGAASHAAKRYHNAVCCDPTNATAWIGLGLSLGRSLNHVSSANAFRRAICLSPDDSKGYGNLAVVTQTKSHVNARADLLGYAVRLQPAEFLDQHNLGILHLAETENLALAGSHLSKALALAPSSASTLCNLGVFHRDSGRFDQAFYCFTQAKELSPSDPETQWNLALSFLTLGQYREGWPLYEKRHHLRTRELPPLANVPVLSQEALRPGCKILVYCEQGLGDSVQFARFINRLADLGAETTLRAPQRLVPLLRSSSLNCAVADSDSALINQEFDFQVSVLSLPHILGLYDERDFASVVPYLNYDPERVHRWLPYFDFTKLRIGVAWQGRKTRVDLGRSFPLENLAIFTKHDEIQLICLQTGAGFEQISTFSGRTRLTILGDELDKDGAFLDTVAIIRSLDLVITSDTAIAHIAGALGAPVWIALSAAPDWRWGHKTADSAWYPSAKLFRQTTLGDWNSVFKQMHDELLNRSMLPLRAR